MCVHLRLPGCWHPTAGAAPLGAPRTGKFRAAGTLLRDWHSAARLALGCPGKTLLPAVAHCPTHQAARLTPHCPAGTFLDKRSLRRPPTLHLASVTLLGAT